MIFQDRAHAGRMVAETLLAYEGQDVVVYALPRGGVILGVEVAKALHAQLDLIVVRKIGHPNAPEYAIGAVSADGHHIENLAEVRSIGETLFNQACRAEQEEARRRRDLFLRGQKPIAVSGKVAIIVDDGLATGLTMSLAVREIRQRHPAKVVVAVPVASAEAIAELQPLVDSISALYIPDRLVAIGAFYKDFTQVTDQEVVDLMEKTMSAA